MRTSYKHAPVLKGRDNYECLIVEGVPVSQAPCQVGFKCDRKFECPYFVDRESAFVADYAVFNYQLYMNLIYFSDQFEQSQPDIMFCDEAHLAGLEMEKFLTAEISEADIARQGWRRPKDLSVRGMAEWASEYLPDVVDELEKCRRSIFGITGGSAGGSIKGSVRAYKATVGKYNRYRWLQHQLNTFIEAGDAMEQGKSWLFDKNRSLYSVRPVFIEEYSGVLFDWCDKVVLMTATINEADLERIGVTDYEWVEVGSNYPKERRQVYYRPVGYMSRRTEAALMDDMVDAIDDIIEHHSGGGQKGIIHTVSYGRADEFKKRSHYSSLMLTHTSADKSDVLNMYKDSDRPLVLLSPSVTEGEDFPGDQCRYIIIPKVPYADMSDKVVREKMDTDPEWYSWKALQDIIQGSGRGMRSETDFCIIYILDANFERLIKQHKEDVPPWFMEAVVWKG